MSLNLSTVLILITVGISYYGFKNSLFFNRLRHHPYSESHLLEYHRLLTSGFLHGSMGHLLINMFVLYQFGPVVEYTLIGRYGVITGSVLFIFFYFSSVIAANLGTFFKHKNSSGFSSIGASGVTSAMVIIYSLLDPWQMFLFPPVPAFLFGILYLAYSQWAASNRQDQIDHLAHLWGALYGVLFILIAIPESFKIFMTRIIEDFPFR